MASRARLGLVGLGLLLVTACQPIGAGYGADFDYPEAAPVPDGVTVLATDEGADDDDPIRSRQQVIELGPLSQGRLFDFYRDAYPGFAGWRDVKTRDRQQQLCLVNREDPGYVEVVEVYEYTGTRVSQTPTRRLVSVSRIENRNDRGCGLPLAWTSTDLY